MKSKKRKKTKLSLVLAAMGIVLLGSYAAAVLIFPSENAINSVVNIATPNQIFGIQIPKDLNEAHTELMRVLSKELIAKMKKGSEKEMSQYHLGLGMTMRNEWGLWKGSSLAKYFNKLGLYHPDDMSGTILTTFWRKLNNKPLRIEERVKYYQAYWDSIKKKEKEVSEKRKAEIPEDGMLELLTNE